MEYLAGKETVEKEIPGGVACQKDRHHVIADRKGKKMQKDQRMASLFVIVGFSVCFFLAVNSVQLMNVILIENQEAEHMSDRWYNFDTESLIESEEPDTDYLVKQLIAILTQDSSQSIAVVDYWIYEENVMDSVEVNIIFKKQKDNRVCLLGKAYQEHFWHESKPISEIVLSGEKYSVDGVQKDFSPYLSDDKVYLYWDNMTKSQQNNLLETISNDIAGGVILTMEIDESETLQKKYKESIQNEIGVSLVRYEASNVSENFDARIYTSFGKILCPIVLIFCVFNVVIVVQFWVRTNQKEWCIRRYLGYDLSALWWILVKQLLKLMSLSILLGIIIEIIYMQLFHSIVLIQKNILLELGILFAMLAVLLLLLSIAAICETAKYTESIERANL